MSHTKQTPILEYTDAELQSLTVPAGTITLNTTLSCLSYYTGLEWINSDDWESTYTTVSAQSASWVGGDYDDSALQAASGNWESTYTTVSANSANWDAHADLTDIQANSANWDSTYTTTSANSAIWQSSASTAIVWLSAQELFATDPGCIAIDIQKGIDLGFNTFGSPAARDPRGLDAVDLQIAGTDPSHIAGGRFTALLGGYSNKINKPGGGNFTFNEGAVIIGGSTNEVLNGGAYGVIVGGANNLLTSALPGADRFAKYSVILGGNGNTATHDYTCTFSSEFAAFGTKHAGTFNIEARGDTTMQANSIGGLRYIHDSNNHTGDVLTCVSPDGYSSWRSLSADEWNSTYTTVSTNSAAWGTGYDDTWLSIASGDWESTYTTVSANSANWSDGAATSVVYVDAVSTNFAALVAKVGNTGYSQVDNKIAGNTRGDLAVDLQLDRHPTVGADQVASGSRSVIIGGYQNKASGQYSAVLGGGGNKSNNQYSVTFGLQNQSNANHGIACGYNAQANHDGTFIWSDSAAGFATAQSNTFNIRATNGLRLYHDTNDHTNHVLTCLDSNGHGKWQALSANPDLSISDWDSAYTTINTTSATGNVVTAAVSTSTYTQEADKSHILYDTTSNSITVTLLTPANHKGEITHMITAGNTNTVTLSSNTAATINGNSSLEFTGLYKAVKVFTDGINFYAMSGLSA